MARRGAWIEYDWIGNADAFYLRRIQDLLNAGLGHRVLISHDRGWYAPSRPNGGIPQPFNYISQVFVLKSLTAGVDDAAIVKLTQLIRFGPSPAKLTSAALVSSHL
ncbi:MAG: hypothetical protein JXN59_12825 [Anaerolineae bacterium]|nr:hypothetical protein [Anaerolineae bacterium]